MASPDDGRLLSLPRGAAATTSTLLSITSVVVSWLMFLFSFVSSGEVMLGGRGAGGGRGERGRFDVAGEGGRLFDDDDDSPADRGRLPFVAAVELFDLGLEDARFFL